MRERPKQSTRHDRAERNDPNTGHLLENKEITIRAQAGAAVKEKELLAARFANKINKKEREKETKKSRKSQFISSKNDFSRKIQLAYHQKKLKMN